MDCSLPCWHQVRPGVSSEEELLEITEQFPRNFASLSRHENTETITYRWFDKELRLIVTAFIKNDIVQLVRINARGQINLGQLVSSLGQPSHYKASLVGGSGAGDQYSFSAVFIHEEVGITYRQSVYPSEPEMLQISNGCSIVISKEFPIEWIYVVEDVSVSAEFPEVSGGNTESTEPWAGFGEVRLTECQP
jgi:hypothetical protein